MAGQKTITQRIAFEGGAEMEVQLKRLGDAGTTAFVRIKAAADSAGGIGDKVAAGIEVARARFIALGDSVNTLGDRFGALREKTGTVVTRIATATGTVVALAAGFTLLAKEVAKTTEEIENGAAAAGLSVDRYQLLKNGFDVAGIEGEKFSALMNRLNKSMGDGVKADLEYNKSQKDITDSYLKTGGSASDYLDKLNALQKGNTEQINLFNRLGISVKDFGGNSEAALNGVLDALAKLPRGIERSSLELEIFGRAGSRIDAIVDKGSAGLAELVADAQRVAPALSKAQLAIGQTLDDAFDRLRLSAKNVQQQFFLTFGPLMTSLVNAVTDAIVRNRASILAFAETLATTVKPVVDDIVKLLNGETVDPNGLVGKVIPAVKQFATDVVTAVGIVVAAWNGFVAVLDVVAKGINAIFGTNFTGQALAIVAVLGVVTGAFSALAALFSAIIAVVGVFDAALVLAFGPEGALLIGLALLGAAIGALIVQIPSVGAAFQALIDGFNGTVNNFKTLFALIGVTWQLLWQGMVQVVTDATAPIIGFVQSIIDKIKAAASAFAGLFGGGSGATSSGANTGTPGFAGGGKVRGRGTQRSDSILARLSNGEFVQQAPAVRYYGERFMSALNHLQIPRGVFDGLSGFANGGLARTAGAMMIPGFANGGLASFGDMALASSSGGRPLVLNIDGESFSGLTADDRTAERLTRFANRRNIESAGRKPLWRT